MAKKTKVPSKLKAMFKGMKVPAMKKAAVHKMAKLKPKKLK